MFSTFNKRASADDWYFSHENANGKPEDVIVCPIATWVMNEEGHMIGMIATNCNEIPQRLHPIPPVAGRYCKGYELTEYEKRSLEKHIK